MAASSILGIHLAVWLKGTGTAVQENRIENFRRKFRNRARVRENRDECMRISRAAIFDDCKVSEL
jgi:hypothetical protein